MEVSVPKEQRRAGGRRAPEAGQPHGEAQGLPPGQGADQGHPPAVRRPGAPGSRRRSDAVELRRGRDAAEAEPGSRSAHRADRHRGRARTSSTAPSSRCFPEITLARPWTVSRSYARWPRSPRRTSTRWSRTCASSVRGSMTVERESREGDRVTMDFDGPDRRHRVRGQQGRRRRRDARRRPHAQGIRERHHRHEGGRGAQARRALPGRTTTTSRWPAAPRYSTCT